MAAATSSSIGGSARRCGRLPFMARMRRSGVPLYRRRSGRRRPVIWAFDAVSAPPGQRHHALLIASEIAGSCTGVCEGPEAPWVGVGRLRRCRLDFAKQRRSDQKKPWDWQMHRSLPEPDCSLYDFITRAHEAGRSHCATTSKSVIPLMHVRSHILQRGSPVPPKDTREKRVANDLCFGTLGTPSVVRRR
jgi:hypothetical protein